LLSQVIVEALEARGLKVRGYVFGRGVPMEDQWVDLTHQNIDDVLTVKMGSEGVMTLLGMGEGYRKWRDREARDE
jgi:hypothetical protein